jgi:hypothetical protein
MQMNESFAAAASAVAPVVLLAGAVEVAAYQRAVEPVFQRIFTTSQEVLDIVTTSDTRRFPQPQRDQLLRDWKRSGWQTLAGLAWGFIMLGQALVTIGCLSWLATPEDPLPWTNVKFTIIVTSIGVLAVAIVPTFRLMIAPYVGARRAHAADEAAD